MSTATPQPGVESASKVPDNKEAERAGAMQIVGFRLANEEYGVDIMHVQEIILLGQITKIPDVPNYICGLINLRGHVIPIVDLRKRFNLAAPENSEHARIIVVNVGDRTIGVVVDAVSEVLRISPEQIEPPPGSTGAIDHNYIVGLVKLDKKLVILLNIHEILGSAVLNAEHASKEGCAA